MSVLTYGPGETVPHPGVYAVIHGKPHTQYKELFVERGTFPSCQVCSAQVTFRLIRAVENILEDPDFRLGDPAETRRVG
jgi:hypothetical protein